MAGRGSIDHLSQVLDLFREADVVSLEDVCHSLKMTRSTGYRTMKGLADIGFLDRMSEDAYVLGPRVLELYRLLQLGSPLLATARPVMLALAAEAPPGSTALLCRAYRDQVMCVHQEVRGGPQSLISYHIGRPMGLYRGSASKVILANFDRRRLVKLYAKDHVQIAASGMGASLEEFLVEVSKIRKAGYQVTRGEIDRGRVAVSAVLLDTRHSILGSITLALTEAGAEQMGESRAVMQVVAAAHEVLRQISASEQKPLKKMSAASEDRKPVRRSKRAAR